MFKMMKMRKSLLVGAVALILVAVLMFIGFSGAISASADSIRLYSYHFVVEDELQYLPELPAETMRGREIDSSETPYIIIEDITRRTSHVRYFYMSNGSFMREEFAEPIHFADKDGKYQVIDNSFIRQIDEDGVETIANSNNAFEAEFAIDPNSTAPLATIRKNGTSLEFFAVENFTTEEELENDEESAVVAFSQSTQQSHGHQRHRSPNAQVNSRHMHQRGRSLDFDYSNRRIERGVMTGNLTTEIAFPSIMPNIDRHYQVTPTGINESITINAQQEEYSFQFLVRAYGLELILSRNNELFAYNYRFERIFNIAEPFMFDSLGEHNFTDVVFDLEYLGSYYNLLTITACSEWLNHEERAFPVRIEPMNVRAVQMSGIAPLRVFQYGNTGNFIREGTDNAYIRNSGRVNVNTRMVGVEIPAADSNNIGAYLMFDIAGRWNSNTPPPVNERYEITARKWRYGLTSSLNPLFARWNLDTQSSSLNNIVNLEVTDILRVQEGNDFRDVFRIVFSVEINRPHQNYQPTTSHFNLSNFRASRFVYNPAQSRHPINFGGENFHAEIDLISLNQRVIVPYFVQQSEVMPIEIFGVHNPGFSAKRNDLISNSRISPHRTNFYGLDMKLNIQQFMLPSGSSTRRFYYTFIDAMGDRHVFTRRTDGVFRSSTTSLEYIPIVRMLGTPLNPQMFRFDALGRLNRIRNYDGQFINITFAAGTNSATNPVGAIRSVSNNFATIEFEYQNGKLDTLRFQGMNTLSTRINYDGIGRVSAVGDNRATNAKNVQITYVDSNIETIGCNTNSGRGFHFEFWANNVQIRETFNGVQNLHSRKRLQKGGRDRVVYYQCQGARRTWVHTFDNHNRLVVKTDSAFCNITSVQPPTKRTRVGFGTSAYSDRTRYSTIISHYDGRTFRDSDFAESQIIETTMLNTGAFHSQTIITEIFRFNRPIERHTQNIDSFGRITSERHQTLRDDIEIFYQHNTGRRHRLERVRKRDSSGFIEEMQFQNFNSFGQPQTIWHDALNRNGIPARRVIETISYDAFGGITSHTKNAVTQNFENDFLGRDASGNPTTRNRGIISHTVGGENINFYYDRFGDFTHAITVLPNGRTLRQEARRNHSYDRFGTDSNRHYMIGYYQGNLSFITNQNHNALLSFDSSPNGNINAISFGNNQRMVYEHNGLGQMTEKRSYDCKWDLEPTQTFVYNHNSRGELSRVTFDGLTRTFTRGTGVQTMTLRGLTTLPLGGSRDFSVTTSVNTSATIHMSTNFFTPHSITYSIGTIVQSRNFSVEESRGFASARQITVRDGRFTTRYNFERDSRL
ncbi:MAG: hypothetical protein FWC11_05290, partial [Firmicutes bacterium]|nr:hypothetical protein [Bacillota bacterium]